MIRFSHGLLPHHPRLTELIYWKWDNNHGVLGTLALTGPRRGAVHDVKTVAISIRPPRALRQTSRKLVGATSPRNPGDHSGDRKPVLVQRSRKNNFRTGEGNSVLTLRADPAGGRHLLFLMRRFRFSTLGVYFDLGGLRPNPEMEGTSGNIGGSGTH